MTMHDKRTSRVKFTHSIGKVTERNQLSSHIYDLILMRFTHIDDEDVLPFVQTLL